MIPKTSLQTVITCLVALFAAAGAGIPALQQSALGQSQPADKDTAARRVPVIDVTDLYHPHQDVGDNFDLIAAYALPEIDLKAVVLDITGRFRQPVADLPEYNMKDTGGPREPGLIPVAQLNYIFDRNVPVGIGPFTPLKTPDDAKLDAPKFQQTGIQLLIDTLKSSREMIEIVSFGSARPIAAAYNREPQPFHEKVRRIHLCAGTSSPDYLEWNIMLDGQANIRLLQSDLPIAIYPCATKDGPFAYGPHNCFWLLPDLRFIARMDPPLRRYLGYAFTRSGRIDFLRAMDEDLPDEVMKEIYTRRHNVWETAVWAQVANRRLVRHPDGRCRLIPASQVKPGDKILPNELRPCKVQLRDNGLFSFELTDQPTNLLIHDRGDPHENEKALRDALPALYESFKTPARLRQAN